MFQQDAPSKDDKFKIFCHQLIREQIRVAFDSLPAVTFRDLPEAFERNLSAAILHTLLGTRALRRPYDFGRRAEATNKSVADLHFGISEGAPHPLSTAFGHGGRQPNPRIGDIVHFTEHSDHPPVAAIITAVDDSTDNAIVSLHTFPVASGGSSWSHTPFSEIPKPGHWSWPPSA